MKQGRLTVWLAVVAVLAGESAMLAGPARAQDDELSTSALAFFDRVEFAGGWTRERYELQTGDELGRLATYGARFERMVSPILTFGLNVGRVERTGSRLPAPEDGTTGSLYARVDDDDIGYGAGFNFDRAPGFPVMSGFARVGPEYDLHISASYANGLPTFSSDDVDVGMGAPVGDDGALWLGASTPFCRDVVSFKAVGRYRLAEAFEVTASGRFGNSRAGRVDGFSLGVAYVAPERSVHVPGKGTWLAGLLAPQSGRLHYLGAGAVAGAIGGVMAAGVAAQRPCGEASFRAAVVGVAAGSVLGALFGGSFW